MKTPIAVTTGTEAAGRSRLRPNEAVRQNIRLRIDMKLRSNVQNQCIEKPRFSMPRRLQFNVKPRAQFRRFQTSRGPCSRAEATTERNIELCCPEAFGLLFRSICSLIS
jgi:hypothetical protein